MDSAFTALVAGALGATPFRLLDIGCSGGLDPRRRPLGTALHAIGPAASRGGGRRPIDPERQASPLILAVRERLSFMRTREIRAARLAKAEIEEQMRHN